MQLCIFEDVYCDRFAPLIYYRPVYDLICGANSIREKILRAYPALNMHFIADLISKLLLKAKIPG